MNTRRAILLIVIAGLLGLHTVYTRTAALDYSLRTGQLYASADRLAEEKLQLEVNLSIIRQPVSAARLASQYCPTLAPACPELAAYQLAQDVPPMEVPSLRKRQAEAAAREPHPAEDPAMAQVAALESTGSRHVLDPQGFGPSVGSMAQGSVPAAPAAAAVSTLPPSAVVPTASMTQVSNMTPVTAPRPVPIGELPPVDRDDPDSADAPQPVEWPEEPADNAPVVGCLPAHPNHYAKVIRHVQ